MLRWPGAEDLTETFHKGVLFLVDVEEGFDINSFQEASIFVVFLAHKSPW